MHRTYEDLDGVAGVVDHVRMNERGATSGRRRRFDGATKRRILAEYAAAVAPGSKKALLDRERINRSHIASWRKALAAEAGPAPIGDHGARSEPLSRDTIVQAAVRLLTNDPGHPLSMAKVAKEAGVAPMSLYRYFRDRTDMLNEVAWSLTAHHPDPEGPDATWEDRLRTWMTSTHDRAVAFPQLTNLMATGNLPAWLNGNAALLDILESAGIKDDTLLAHASYWIGMAAMGHAMVHVLMPDQAPTRQFYAALSRLPEADAARVARVLPGIGEMHTDAFGVIVDFTVAGLASLVRDLPSGASSQSHAS